MHVSAVFQAVIARVPEIRVHRLKIQQEDALRSETLSSDQRAAANTHANVMKSIHGTMEHYSQLEELNGVKAEMLKALALSL